MDKLARRYGALPSVIRDLSARDLAFAMEASRVGSEHMERLRKAAGVVVPVSVLS